MKINEDFSLRAKLKDIGRWYITKSVIAFSNTLPVGSMVLDAGAGECVYKKYFSHCDYKAIDLAVGESRWNYTNLDYVAPLDDMPIPDKTFDAILCTEVLEHLEWPRESVTEMYRILKKDGRLFITVPMAHREHQIPYDFFRYTSYGLKSICEHAGFRNVRIYPFGGIWVRWAHEMPNALSIFPSAGIRNKNIKLLGVCLLPIKIAALFLIKIFQLLFLILDKFDRNNGDTFGWCCEALK